MLSLGEEAYFTTPRRSADKTKLKTTSGTTITKNTNEISDDKVMVS
jgi:hypothetical protein